MSETGGGLPASSLYIFGAVVAGVSLIGFFRGTSHDDYDFQTPIRAVAANAPSAEGVPVARSYQELRDAPRGAGSGFDQDLAAWFEALPARSDAVELSGTKEDDLAARADRRAYDGAPPVIPHPVRQRSASECKACHEKGARIAGRQAPAYPHRDYVSCTQCHAMAAPNPPWGDGASAGLEPDPRAVSSSFVGLPSPEAGPRWTGIAPPRIPHKTFMHERCDSCHGVSGRNAMRSTHPDRQNCEQCHASQSDLEWRPGGRK